ncbi:MAG: SDR family NAD(P)-dependent oxidoreductase [Candidatus Woesearchaeota archaeon]
MKTALITGASYGIGLELARVHAENKNNLVLVARSKDKLETLKKELEKKHNIKIHIIQKDLSLPNSAKDIYQYTKKNKITIDYLINNAGFGGFGEFKDTDIDNETNMINLNITSLVQLTKYYLQDMIKQKQGKIMNVASIAGFIPGPLMSVYFATKSFVVSFSQAINYEVKGTGVTVTTLCPGPTKSNFFINANVKDNKMFSNKSIPTSREVAEYGYKSMMKGKSIAIHGIKNRILVSLTKFIPVKYILYMTKKMQEND